MCVCSRKEGQVAKSTVSLPWFVVNNFLDSIASAERKLGYPPCFAEVLVELNNQHPWTPIYDGGKALGVCMAMIREDWVYVDPKSYRVS